MQSIIVAAVEDQTPKFDFMIYCYKQMYFIKLMKRQIIMPRFLVDK